MAFKRMKKERVPKKPRLPKVSRKKHDTGKQDKQAARLNESADRLTDMAQNTKQEESESERIIHELNVSNDETKEAVMQVAEQISVMSSSIRDITTALDMIRNVADETTLLALNAGIEAARAGGAFQRVGSITGKI